MANKKKTPALPLDTREWLESKSLRYLSLEDKGLLIELLCYMWESSERGVLVHSDGAPYTIKDIELLVTDNVSLEKLLAYGALAVREDGAYYSPAIMKILDISEKRRLAGKKGGDVTKAKTLPQAPPEPPEEPKVTEPVLFPEVVEEAKTETEKKLSALEQEFDAFRKAYQGTKRGLKTELANLQKKYPKEWKTLIPQFMPALQRYIEWRKQAIQNNQFVPEWAHLSTWINQRRWETEYESINNNSNGNERSTADQGAGNQGYHGFSDTEGESPDGRGEGESVHSQKDYSERF